MRLLKLGLAAAALAARLAAVPALSAQDAPRADGAGRRPPAGRGRGAVPPAGDPRRDADRRLGAPPRGPVDIVIAGNRIESISGAGTPGLPLAPNRPPRDADREIDGDRHVRPARLRRHARP